MLLHCLVGWAPSGQDDYEAGQAPGHVLNSMDDNGRIPQILHMLCCIVAYALVPGILMQLKAFRNTLGQALLLQLKGAHLAP